MKQSSDENAKKIAKVEAAQRETPNEIETIKTMIENMNAMQLHRAK